MGTIVSYSLLTTSKVLDVWLLSLGFGFMMSGLSQAKDESVAF